MKLQHPSFSHYAQAPVVGLSNKAPLHSLAVRKGITIWVFLGHLRMFPSWRAGRFVLLSMVSPCRVSVDLGSGAKRRHRDVLPPSIDSPLVRHSQVAGVLLRYLRRACPSRRPYLLGRGSSNAPQIYR